jgi:catechol 2,3-dioxygenase-like lactoylglutathione lyase family enzyme
VLIDHIKIGVTDVERARAFYEAALAPLGIVVVLDYPGTVGFGKDAKPEFFIRRTATPDPAHVAFAADRATVDAFHAAALAAGGTDNGGPGVRELYHPAYYGAFVLDPDGHNIEAVSHRPAGD